MTRPRDAVRARELFATLRRENPEIARAERQMGSRLVLARNVLRLRVRAGMTQTELAERAGMAQSRIAQVESGRANVTVDTLDRIASAFAVQVASLFKATPLRVASREEKVTLHARPADTVGWGRARLPHTEVSAKKADGLCHAGADG